MDPNAALETLREALEDYRAAGDGSEEKDYAAYDVAEVAAALDEWLSKGGFLPTAWQH